MAKIKRRPLPPLPPYYSGPSRAYFIPNINSEHFLVTKKNIENVLADLKSRLSKNSEQIIGLLNNLVTHENIRLYISLSNQFYYLIIERKNSNKKIVITAFTISGDKLISSLDSLFSISGAKTVVQILDIKDENLFKSMNAEKIQLTRKEFDDLINNFISTGTLPVASQSNNKDKQTSPEAQNNHKASRHLFAGNAGYNATFVKRINKDVLNGLFSDPDIVDLVLTSKETNFAQIYKNISATIKEALTLNKEVDESQLESEAQKVFLCLIIKRKVYMISKKSTQNQKQIDPDYIPALIKNFLAKNNCDEVIEDYKKKLPQLRARRRKEAEKEVADQIAMRNKLREIIKAALAPQDSQDSPESIPQRPEGGAIIND